jgi:SecD/SecF fusion protein
MKTTGYFIFIATILSLTMGCLLNLTGQETVVFSETYKTREITGMLDPGDRFFQLLDTGLADPDGASLGSCKDSDATILWDHIHSEAFLRQLPEDIRFAWGQDSGSDTRMLFALRLSNERLAPGKKEIQAVTMKKGVREGSYDLLITFTEEGALKWAQMTRENLGRNIAIVINGKVVTAPKVMAEIRQGKCLISGDLSKDEAGRIKQLLET